MIKKQQGIIPYGHEADAVAAALSQPGSRRGRSAYKIKVVALHGRVPGPGREAGGTVAAWI
jgi:hypothetical protein